MNDPKKDYLAEFFTTTLIGPGNEDVKNDVFFRAIFRLEPKPLSVLEDELHAKYTDLLLERMTGENGVEEVDQIGVTVILLADHLQAMRKDGTELDAQSGLA